MPPQFLPEYVPGLPQRQGSHHKGRCMPAAAPLCNFTIGFTHLLWRQFVDRRAIDWRKVAMENENMIRTVIAAAILAFSAAPASATYIYRFDPPPLSTCTGRVCTHPYNPDSVYDFFPAELSVSDAAVASGRFDLTLYGNSDSYKGDIDDFVSLVIGTHFAQEIASPSHWIGQQGMHVTFNPDGTLTGGVVGGDYLTSLSTTGSEFNWWGNWGSDYWGSCYDQNFGGGAGGYGCANFGYWHTDQALPDPVPEPGSLSILAGGLAALMFGLWRLKDSAR